jgi:hypothetical protein
MGKDVSGDPTLSSQERKARNADGALPAFALRDVEYAVRVVLALDDFTQ